MQMEIGLFYLFQIDEADLLHRTLVLLQLSSRIICITDLVPFRNLLPACNHKSRDPHEYSFALMDHKLRKSVLGKKIGISI